MKKLIPVLIALVGILGGAGAGFVLRPAPTSETAPEDDHTAPAEPAATDTDPAEAPAQPAAEDHAEQEPAGEGHDGNTAVPDYVKLSNQFIVPVVEDGRVAAMVILSLTLESSPGATEAVYAREPKLRDAFLQVLFDHANAGGFRGAFTDGTNLVFLRSALLEVAQKIMPGVVSDVLIADIVRQDN